MSAVHRLLRAAAAVLAALLLAACEESVDLQGNLTDPEANEVVAALREAGIAAAKRTLKEGAAVSLPAADLPRASAVLEALGLPRPKPVRLGDVFKKEGLISSPMEERARYLYALSQELEFTLRQIDGVVIARVHVVLPEKPAPGEPLTPSSAAVFIKHTPSLDPDVVQARVRQLVARSIPGLGRAAAETVSTVFVPASAVPPRPPAPPEAQGLSVWTRLAITLGVLGALGGAGWWQRTRLTAMWPPRRGGPAASSAPPSTPTAAPVQPGG